MTELSDLPLPLRLFARGYRWRAAPAVEPARLRTPVTEATVAVVSSAGLVAPGDEPFRDDVRGGDWSWRTIPDAIDVQTLAEHHRSDAFDHTGIEADRNIAMPLDRLHELVATGTIARTTASHVSVMGSITAPGRFRKHSIPEIVDHLAGEKADIALLIPV
jgi:hypothetical protein